MANLQEKPIWETGIYQLETSDPVLGGPDGIDNLQGKQLANRTAYLKKQTDDLVSGALAAECAGRLKAPRTLGMTGDGSWNVSFDGSGNVSGAFTLAGSGVAAGGYGMVTVDAKGRVTSGRQMTAADVPALDWSKIASGKPSTLAGYGISDAAFKDGQGRVWGAAFRAEKGDPAESGDDAGMVGFAFGVDGDTGLFAAKSVEPGRGSAKLALKIDNVEQFAVSNAGAIYARQYGWLHDKFAAKAATLAGYGIADAMPIKPSLGAADLNAIIDDGIYHNPLNANATLNRNYPATQAGMLLVFSDDQMVYQQYQCFADAGFWYRCRYQSAWQPWRRNADVASTLAGYGIADAASKAELQAAVNNLVAGAPAALDTLKEPAAALDNDGNYAATVRKQLAGKVDASAFDGAIGPRGYQKQPGGLVEQWFSVGFAKRDELVAFTFPIAMAEVHGVWLSAQDAEGEVSAILSAPPTQTGGQLRTRGIYGGPPDVGAVYIRAIGKL